MSDSGMTAEERARVAMGLDRTFLEAPTQKQIDRLSATAEQIRQAEQAAREEERRETIEEVLAWTDWASYPELILELNRALKDKP